MIRSLGAVTLAAALLMPLAAAAQQVTPHACNATTVTTGGTAVIAIQGPANGFYISNPLTTGDEGIGAVEPLFVDPVNTATTTGNGTNQAVAAGSVYPGSANPGSATGGGVSGNVTVNAATSGHKFTCVRW